MKIKCTITARNICDTFNKLRTGKRFVIASQQQAAFVSKKRVKI